MREKEKERDDARYLNSSSSVLCSVATWLLDAPPPFWIRCWCCVYSLFRLLACMCGCRTASLVSYIVADCVSSWVKTWDLSSVRTLLIPRERLAKLVGLHFVCVVRLQKGIVLLWSLQCMVFPIKLKKLFMVHFFLLTVCHILVHVIIYVQNARQSLSFPLFFNYLKKFDFSEVANTLTFRAVPILHSVTSAKKPKQNITVE